MRNLARTLGAGRSELRTTLGGPILSVPGATFPIPSVRIGYRHGITDYLDLDSNVTLDAFALGLLAFDAGVVGQLYRDPNGAAVSISAHTHFFIDLDDDATTRVYPELALHAEHRIEPSLTIFFGGVLLAQLDPPREKPTAFFAPYLGAELWVDQRGPVHDAIAVQLAWISPWEDMRAFGTWEPAGYGALVFHIGWRAVYGGASEGSLSW